VTDGEQTVETTSTARVLDTGSGSVLLWIDGPFETRSFEIPTEDAQTFSGYGTLDCRAIVYRCDRGGGRLRALYPVGTGGEVRVRYDLRDGREYNHKDVATVASVRHSEEPMGDDEIERRWTVLWEPTEGGDSA
jgi:hypothetical protein